MAIQFKASRRVAALVAALAMAGGATGCLSGELNAPKPSRMEAQSGNAQLLAPNQRAKLPFVVKVFDQNFTPMEGETITWTILSGGGTLDSVTTMTRADGTTQNHYTSGSALGFVEITASLEGLGSVRFTVRVENPPGT